MAESPPRNIVDIDAEGRMKIESEAQKRLALHPGRYRVVPTTGELVLLQKIGEAARTETSSVGIPPGKVAIAGEIDSVGGLVDIVNFIHGNAWSGQLAAVDGVIRKTLYFRRGDIRTAASNVPEDRLGAILYRYGMISEQELAEAVRSVGVIKIGQALVEKGSLSPHDLYTYVRKQIEEIFFTVLVMRRGAFYFYRTGDDEGPASQLQISTKSLLFEGVRRIDELSYFRQKLPSGEVVLVRRLPLPSEKLGPREERLFSLIDGVRDLAGIARLSHLGEFEATKILYQLVQSGFVQVRESQTIALAKMKPGDSIENLYGRVVDTFNVVFVKIHAAVSLKSREAALAKGLESFFASAADFAPLFVAVELGADGSLPRDQVLANLQIAPTDNKLEYLHRGLNELLFFELFTAGEAVDRREEIELHQRLNDILRERSEEDLAPEITVERGSA